jgi:Putative porin
MNKNLIAGCVALIIAATTVAPAMADSASDLAAAQAQIDTLKQQLDRLEATVDYLKANAQAERKETAVTDADVSKLKDVASKYTWSGDFRYRRELIDVANDNLSPDHTRQRDRVRVRFGVLAKVNDKITAKLQLITTNVGMDSGRSGNQTLGTAWDKKPLSIDQAYVEWKPNPMLNVQLGKTPIPWATTVSYFWDKDLTPEGAAFRFARGPFFAGAYYDWLNERNSGSSQAASADATMAGLQAGIKQSFGNSTLTAAIGYFDINGVQDQIAKYSQTQIADLTTGAVTTTTCTIDGAFGNGFGTGDNSFGNTTYTGPAPQVGSSTTCTRLLSDFNVVTGLLQFDTKLGAYPFSVFVDYMKNNAAKLNPTVNRTLDSASAIGFTFNKAAAPGSWEFSTVYEQNGKDAVFGQFVDSDFGGGATDSKGFSFKGAYVPAINWTLNATYFFNKLNYDGVLSNNTKHELDYKRVQLDLNYKY